MQRKAAKELHIRGWLDRVEEVARVRGAGWRRLGARRVKSPCDTRVMSQDIWTAEPPLVGFGGTNRRVLPVVLATLWS